MVKLQVRGLGEILTLQITLLRRPPDNAITPDASSLTI